jgi:4'-phosphopantetheinyl transferase EntD
MLLRPSDTEAGQYLDSLGRQPHNDGMSDEREPAWLTNLVQTLAAETGIAEAVIRKHPKFKLIRDSQDAVEFVIELEEELN